MIIDSNSLVPAGYLQVEYKGVVEDKISKLNLVTGEATIWVKDSEGQYVSSDVVFELQYLHVYLLKPWDVPN